MVVRVHSENLSSWRNIRLQFYFIPRFKPKKLKREQESVIKVNIDLSSKNAYTVTVCDLENVNKIIIILALF